MVLGVSVGFQAGPCTPIRLQGVSKRLNALKQGKAEVEARELAVVI